MIISGIQPLTLLDYPNHIAATVFIGGCNFRCPFCHNRDLVENPQEVYSLSSTLKLLKERARKLEGICITGGEPTLEGSSLTKLILAIREMGLKVKLDTNGTNPTLLQSLIDQKLLNYVAMDIKTSRQNYCAAAGIPNCHIMDIEESVEILKKGVVPYEFRTTMVRNLISGSDIVLIGKWLEGADQYYLQKFVDSPNNIRGGLQGYEEDEMGEFAKTLRHYINKVELRGV